MTDEMVVDGTRDDPASELDRLFDMTNRGPFSGYRPEEILGEVSTFPLTPAGMTQDLWLPLPLHGYIIGGSYNDRFIAGPEDGTGSSIIDISNKLPGWNFVDDSTNGAAASWELQADGAARIAFTMTDGQVGDRVYIEQYQYVPGGNINIICPSGFFYHGAAASTADIKPFIEYTYIKADGTEVGTATEKTYTGVTEANFGAINRIWLMTRTKAYAFLRLRYGYKIVNNPFVATDKALGELDWCWTSEPASYDVSLQFSRSGWSPTNGGGPFSIKMGDHDVAYGVSKWVAPSPGMLLAIGVMTNDTISSGTMQFYARVNSVDAADPQAGLTSVRSRAVDNRDLDNVTAFDFARLDTIDIQARETGVWSSTGGADYAGTLTMRMVFDNAQDATSGGIGEAGI